MQYRHRCSHHLIDNKLESLAAERAERAVDFRSGLHPYSSIKASVNIFASERISPIHCIHFSLPPHYIQQAFVSNKMKSLKFERGGKKSGAFPSLDRDTHGRIIKPNWQNAAAMAASPPPHNYTEKPFNPEQFVIDTKAETATVSTLTNDRAFHSKRFNCGIEKHSSTDYIQDKKNWYKNKKENQTYLPLRDNGSAFTAPESSFGTPTSDTHGSSYSKKTSSKKWLGRYVAAKSLLWSWRGEDQWLKKVESSGELAAATTGYSSVFSNSSRSRSSSEEENACEKDEDDIGDRGVLSDVCLTYCDESGVREEQIVWGG